MARIDGVQIGQAGRHIPTQPPVEPAQVFEHILAGLVHANRGIGPGLVALPLERRAGAPDLPKEGAPVGIAGRPQSGIHGDEAAIETHPPASVGAAWMTMGPAAVATEVELPNGSPSWAESSQHRIPLSGEGGIQVYHG